MPATRPIADRLLEKVDPITTGCWIWRGNGSGGYPTIGGKTAAGKHTMLYAHRVSYEYFIGPIPEGLHLDHLCRTPLCVNPTHLEPVTNRENFMRGMHQKVQIHRARVCPRGHELTGANAYRRPGAAEDSAACKTCRRDRTRESRRRRHMEEEAHV